MSRTDATKFVHSATRQRSLLQLLTLCMLCSASNLPGQTKQVSNDREIVRLEPSVFPGLPAVVRRDLERRGCRIPQVSQKIKTPHNVVHGAFLNAARKDWAILCSIAGASEILVYADGSGTASYTLARAEDDNFLQGGVGFSRLIEVAGPARIQRYGNSYSGPKLSQVPDHAGIEDAFVEKASTVHYFQIGKWLTLQGAD